MLRLLLIFLVAALYSFASPLCQSLFPSAVGTTDKLGGSNDCVTINGGGKIFGSTSLQTSGFCNGANWGVCNGGVCSAVGSNISAILLPSAPLIPSVIFTHLDDINSQTTLNINSNTNFDHITVNSSKVTINLNNGATLNVANGITFNSASTMNINDASVVNATNGITMNSNSIININGNAIINTTALTMNKGVINIAGNVVIYANTAYFNTANINIISGSLQIYAYSDVAINNGASLNSGGAPAGLIIATTGSLSVNSGPNSFFGYALGDVVVNHGGNVTGGLTGARVTVNGIVTYSNNFLNIPSSFICVASGGIISSFNAWEPTLSPASAQIYSKYAGQNFTLTLGAFDANGTAQKSSDLLTVSLINEFNSTLSSSDINFGGNSQINANFTINNAAKNVKIKFVNKNPSGVCANGCFATDSFGVRPAYFAASNLNQTQSAGTPFALNLTANNINGQITTGYYGQVSSKLNVTNKSGCQTLDALSADAVTFVNGALNTNAKFTDVGAYVILDSSWLSSKCVAASSSNLPDASGKIGCNASYLQEINSRPYDFKFSALSFDKGYAYMLKDSGGALSLMNAGLSGTLSARACNANQCQTALNYSSGCYANGSTFTLNLPLRNGLTLQKIDTVTSSSAKDLGFNAGVLTFGGININYYTSSATPQEPLTLDGSNTIFSFLDPVYNVSAQSGAADFSGSYTNSVLLYARLNVPEQTCYSTSCNNFKLYIETYASNQNILPSPASASPNGINWNVMSASDNSTFNIMSQSGFTLSSPLSASGMTRTFGVSAVNVPSMCVISASFSASPWFKYKTNQIGAIFFEKSSSSGWSGSGDKTQGVILENGAPGYIRNEKINR